MVIEEAREEHYREINEMSDASECTDDSDTDPSFDIVEETRSTFSKISLKKSRSSRRQKDVDADLGSESEMEAMGDEIPKLDYKDEKCFKKVEELINGGHFEKLKLDQCKVYLRKHGLRLTGNKAALLSRIKEHQEIRNGCGEKKYPPESFLLNCKGDACLGDVVIFEQNVYDMYNIASRSATGPPCGTRTVAGRIVKESYGAAKQQHTFTIEVLWSKGVKPLQPLQQLLIKGRNLYRIKTMRQRWVDEGERWKILQEKHARGSCARFSRENRLQQKAIWKNGIVNKRKDKNGGHIPSDKENQHQTNPQEADVLQNKIGNNHEEHKHGSAYARQSCENDFRGAHVGGILRAPKPWNVGEHKHGSAYARQSCDIDFRGAHVSGILQAQKPWNVGYANHGRQDYHGILQAPKPWNVGYANHGGHQYYHGHHGRRQHYHHHYYHPKPLGFHQPLQSTLGPTNSASSSTVLQSKTS